MLKGKTTIELTDVQTGKVQKIVHENMVTNAVADMCNTAGFFRPPITCSALNSLDTIAENMFGGMLLWEKPLDLSSADDYYMPVNNNCIGYGCHLSNGTINDKMGTLNESESGRMENGFRFVWDFTTNQGNGQISAVSLVPRVAGQLGLGLEPSKSASSLFVTGANFYSTMLENFACLRPYLFAKGDVLYGVSLYNLGYNSNYVNEHISRNGKKLVLKRVKFPTTKIYLMDKVDTLTKTYSDIEIKLPDNFNINATATSYFGFCNYDNGFIYLCITTSGAGATLATQICKINVDDWSCSVIDINATADKSFTWFSNFTNDGDWISSCNVVRQAQVRNNKLLIAGSPARFIDLSAPTVIQKIVYCDESEANITNLFAPAGKYIYCSNKNSIACMLDTATGKASLLNSTFNNVLGLCSPYYQYSNAYYSNYVVPHIDKKISISVFLMATSPLVPRIGCIAIPHVMTTKNNLDTAVTKTSGQTMKVTYVLTEV